ncbi:unnamed protein product [Paramecium primaurelia]|uniref:Zinc finger protein n=1 Tax=Paramecium primaurelia TaxID=5886 RepID=A0A8S1M4G2_PARPR|nr:unnamed protein product [Paramecium primaurelia]
MQVLIEIATWTHNNHGLFDYESKELKTSKINVKNTTNLILNEDNSDTIIQSDKLFGDCIGSISFEENAIYFKSNSDYQDAYVKIDPKQKQQLLVGDLFKFGRMEYFVSELNNGDKVMMAQDHYNLERHIKIQKKKDPRQCRFCLMDDQEETEDPKNPFLQDLCSCKGLMAYVHFECLKQWVNFQNRISCKQTQNTVQYHWNKVLECDVCKDPLPARVYIENQSEPLQMIQVEKLDGPYIILEQITRQESLSKSLTFMHAFGTCSVSIGRGHNSEIRCQDISVSRNHAIISYEKQWYIEDQNSKFGTLRIIQNKLKLLKEVQEIQIGRVLLKIKII